MAICFYKIILNDDTVADERKSGRKRVRQRRFIFSKERKSEGRHSKRH